MRNWVKKWWGDTRRQMKNDMIHFYLVCSILFLKEIDNFKAFKLSIHLLFLRRSKFNFYQMYVTFFHQYFTLFRLTLGLSTNGEWCNPLLFVNLNDSFSNFINLVVDFIFSQCSTYRRSIIQMSVNYDLRKLIFHTMLYQLTPCFFFLFYL